jgi:hypothetical protein
LERSDMAYIRPKVGRQGYPDDVFVASASHTAWYASLSWLDWLTVVGFALTLVGLYMAWHQAREATNAANAARRAVQRTQEQIRTKQLMVLVPQLTWIANEVDWAIERENFDVVRRFLTSWRNHAGNVHGILMAQAPNESEILMALMASISMAKIADGILFKNEKSTRKDCMKAREAIISAIDQLNPWLGRNSTEAANWVGENGT